MILNVEVDHASAASHEVAEIHRFAAAKVRFLLTTNRYNVIYPPPPHDIRRLSLASNLPLRRVDLRFSVDQ